MAKTWQQSEISYLNRYAATKTLAELARRFEADEARVLAKLAELGLRTKDGKPAAAAAADPVFEVYEEALGHLYKGRWEKAAKLFDRVFTVDVDCVPRYVDDLGHDRVEVLPFAAAPRIHNPIAAPDGRTFDIAFAGTYFAEKHPARREQMEIVVGFSRRDDDILAFAPTVNVTRHTYYGTGRASGGPFENVFLAVNVVGADGRYERCELFEPDQEAAADEARQEGEAPRQLGPGALREDSACDRADAGGAAVEEQEERGAQADERAPHEGQEEGMHGKNLRGKGGSHPRGPWRAWGGRERPRAASASRRAGGAPG